MGFLPSCCVYCFIFCSVACRDMCSVQSRRVGGCCASARAMQPHCPKTLHQGGHHPRTERVTCLPHARRNVSCCALIAMIWPAALPAPRWAVLPTPGAPPQPSGRGDQAPTTMYTDVLQAYSDCVLCSYASKGIWRRAEWPPHPHAGLTLLGYAQALHTTRIDSAYYLNQ